MTSSSKEHGTMKSYVIGFILSIVFSIIPYLLVVNKTINGTALQITILAFAIIQMLIQIIFFLHLGRGPKPNWNLFFFISTASIIAAVVGGSVFIINNLHYNMSPEDKVKKLVNNEGIYQINGTETGACREKGENHKIIVKNATASPVLIQTKQCDTLSFVNEEEESLEITFGEHPDHGAYAGVDDLVIRSGKASTITLSESGTYYFHDHERPEIAGKFIVIPE